MNHLLHLTICPTCLLLFLFCFTTPSTAADANRTLCQPMSCGSNTPNISYPFWIMDKQQRYCGFPAFKLTCKGGAPVLSISTRDYYILDVSYNNNSILVVDGVLHNNTTSCPRPVRNITLETTPFSINSAYKNNLRFFVDCKEPQEVHGFNRISCNGSNTYVGDNQMVLGQWRKFNSCDHSLVVPSSREVEANPSGYVEVLRKGFVLDWEAPYCGRCSGSGGTCGYNTTIASFMCMCSDRSHAAQCDSNATSQGSTTSPEQHDDSKWRRKVLIIGITVILGFIIFILVSCTIIIWKNKKKFSGTNSLLGSGIHGPSEKEQQSVDLDSLIRTEFHLMDIKTATEATNNFADTNKLGEGGFGSVYKGVLPDGIEIAIKRLSSNSSQGAEEFKNEVKLIAKLQHKNLVKLLGCCVEGREKLLVYEYLPNGSLDTFLVDPSKRSQLDWETRRHIVLGITRGLIYLHEDSQLKVVHRDLKPSNILLDLSMNTKISDFGLARIFESNINEANTSRLVGTFGYMAPEFAMAGLFSVKSDVFGFGVLLLEIISGQRNARLHFMQYDQSLLIRAWEIWKEKEGEDLENELVDPSIVGTFPTSEAIRWIQIALLCVQETASDRPKMSTVLRMFETEQMELWEPKQPPSFMCEWEVAPPVSSSDMPECSSANEVTLTHVEFR